MKSYPFFRAGAPAIIQARRLVAAFAIGLATAAAASTADSLVEDGSFELGGFSGFKSFGAVITQRAEEASSGKYAVKLPPGAGIVCTISVKPNTRYEYRIWGRALSSNPQEGIRVGVNRLKGQKPINRGITTLEYTARSVFFTTGPEDTKVDIFAFRDGGMTDGFVDDVTVKEAPLAETPAAPAEAAK